MVLLAAFEYEDLAKAAVLYGWMSSQRTTCDDMASWMDDQVSDSLPSASQAIAGRARELLSSYPTTISQDIQVFNLLQQCAARAIVNEVDIQDTQAGASLTERLNQCSIDVLPDLPNIEVVVLSRLARKAVLSQLIDRLFKTCEN